MLANPFLFFNSKDLKVLLRGSLIISTGRKRENLSHTQTSKTGNIMVFHVQRINHSIVTMAPKDSKQIPPHVWSTVLM